MMISIGRAIPIFFVNLKKSLCYCFEGDFSFGVWAIFSPSAEDRI
jgi:hypothetical protein